MASQAARKPSPELTLVMAPPSSPAANIANPAPTVSRAPIRAAIRSAGTAPTVSPAIMGSSRSPLPMASVPRMPWKYWGMVNSTPTMAMESVAMRTMPEVKPAEWNRSGGSSGRPSGRRARRRSESEKATSTASPASSGTRVQADPQPLSPASINP